MSILVTGGIGYIGSHTVVELLNGNYDVVVVDNFSNSKPEVIDCIKKITGKEFTFYEGDVCDKDLLRKIFQENQIDAVIHFAGYKAVGESVKKPLMYYHNNLFSTINLLEVMEEVGLKVKNIRYYKSQPWSFSGTLLFGFFCDVDGDDTLTVDHEELSVAQWFDRDKIIGQDNDSSLTNEMMMVFAAGKEPK